MIVLSLLYVIFFLIIVAMNGLNILFTIIWTYVFSWRDSKWSLAIAC